VKRKNTPRILGDCEIKMDKPIKGNCKSCEEKYDIQVYQRDENPHFSGYIYQVCPNCNYNPNVEMRILEVINRNAQFRVHPRPLTQGEDARTDITVNADEVFELVLAEVLKIWPKPKTPANPITTPRQGMIYVRSIDLHFQSERSYLGLDWNQTHEALKQDKLRMPTIPEFVEFLKYLNENNRDLYKEITEVRSPYRAEWLDAYFEQRDDGMYILTGNKTNAEKLDDCLMENRTPGISLDHWLSNPGKQGLPKSNSPEGKMRYWNPRNGGVARLNVNSGRLGLRCSWYPSYTYDSLGVFGCAEGTKNSGAGQ
jgi:hypothetical protein